MPAWSLNTIRQRLLPNVIGLGNTLSHPQVEATSAVINQMAAIFEWKKESSIVWAERAVESTEPPTAKLPLQRLVMLLHVVMTKGLPPREQFSCDLGQIAWDLKDALELAGASVASHSAEVKRLWPIRPLLPRLERVEIENFRCLSSLNVSFKPLTVLIGPNDSGKSAFLDSVRYVVQGNPIAPTDRWRDRDAVQVRVAAHSSLGDGFTILAPAQHSQPVTRALPSLQPIAFFHFPSKGVSMSSVGNSDTSGAPTITSDGDNVAALFDYFLRQDRRRFFAATEAMKRLVPGLREINIGTPQAANRSIDLVVEDGYRLPADRASGGVRLLLTFVALAYHPTPPRLVLLEEPETGVHPKRLGDIMMLLREITEGKHGEHAAQVILTTHSPYLLDLVDMNQDQVLVFRRNEDGGRTAEPADPVRLRTFLDEFKLGEVWYNRGEEGLLAKKT
jgi:predicted ATPase